MCAEVWPSRTDSHAGGRHVERSVSAGGRPLLQSDLPRLVTREVPRACGQELCTALKAGAPLIVHEMLLNGSKTGPLGSAGVSMTMIAWTQAQQFTAGELSTILRETGFRKVKVKRNFGYWSVVTGVKP